MSVVVGASDSVFSRVAINRAIEEARLYKVPLILVSHVSTPRSGEAALAYTRALEARKVALEAQADELRTEGLEVDTRVPRSPANLPQALLEVARECQATLIVTAIPRRSPVGKALMGSASQDLFLHADCPVLGIKLPPGEDSYS